LIQRATNGKTQVIDGGLCLLKPSRDDYQYYHQTITTIFKNGMFSSPTSGPDETSLLYTYLTRSWASDGSQPIHKICDVYDVIPWDMPLMVKQALMYNYLEFFKPWLKGRYMQWDEELLWSDLFMVMEPPQPLIDLYKTEVHKMCEYYFTMPEKERKKLFDRMDPKLTDCLRINDDKFTRQRQKYIWGQSYGSVELKDLGEVFSSKK
jgi:hypothetical protein